MSKISVIAFDVFDTIICEDDPEYALPPRQGFAEFILRAKESGIKVVTSSDAGVDGLRFVLEEVFKNRVPFGLEVFDGFFQLAMYPKVYQEIIDHFGIDDSQLMVIGDDRYKDLAGAPVDATKVLVPPYNICNDLFDFNQIPLI